MLFSLPSSILLLEYLTLQSRPLHISTTDGSRFIESFSNESRSAKRGCHIVLSTAKLEDGHTDGESASTSELRQRQQLPNSRFGWWRSCRRRSTTPATKSKYMEQFCICGSEQRRLRKRRRKQQKLQLQHRREQIKRSRNLSETREDILHVSIEEWLTSQDEDNGDGDNNHNGNGSNGGDDQQGFIDQSSSDEGEEYYFAGRGD